MSEIFIPDDPNAGEHDELTETVRDLNRVEATARWNLWLSEQSETIQALAAEWADLRGDRFMLSMSVDRRGRRLFVCSSRFGSSESLQSHEHALFLLVDAHRVRAEDRPEHHARIGGDVKQARREAQAIAKKIRDENPGMSGADRDVLFQKALREREKEKPS